MTDNKKIIFITGASSGIGRKTAVTLAKSGNVVFAGIRRKIDKTELESLSADIKGVYIDVTNEFSINKAFSFISKKTNKLDVLINNAGIVAAAPIEFLSLKNLKYQFDVNTFGTVAVSQKFLPLLHNGRIINISSMASYGLFPYISPYCASKRAMDILMNSFYIENKDNIKVISIKPASIKTPIWEKSIKSAESAFNLLSIEYKNKYQKEFDFLKQQALKSSKNGLEIEAVVDKIIYVINAKNPKPSYNIGFNSYLADLFSKLPQNIINSIVKCKTSL